MPIGILSHSQMQTSYFARLRHLRADPALTPISIARFTPEWADVPIYEALAPYPDMLKMDYFTYKGHFNWILSQLDPQTVWNQLHTIGDGEPVLLCFEAPPFAETNFGHRRMVADWFETELGQLVDEWAMAGVDKAEQMGLF